MRIRDAVEADAGRLAALADPPTDVMRNLVHDRTVRVAEADSADGSTAAGAGTDDADGGAGGVDTVATDDGEGTDATNGNEITDAGEAEILGFVSFDVRDRTVHVTQMEGTPEACERLLEEPVAYARREGMDVELLVPESETTVGDAAEAAGFRTTGSGPRFEGTPTVRYRYDPTEGQTSEVRD